MTQTPKTTKRLHPANSWMILTVLVLVSIILLNLVIQLLPTNLTMFDLTHQKITQISDVTKNYLAQMKEDVVLYRLCITGNEDKAVDQLLTRYDELSDHVSVQAVDPAVHPHFASNYTDKTLSDNSIIVTGTKRSKVLDFNDLLLYNLYYSEDGSTYALQSQMTYSDFTTFFETYTDYFTLGYYSYETLFVGEDAITSAIDYVCTDVLPTVYLTTGHGEASFPESLTGYLSRDNIDCAEYSALATQIPADANAILIYSPTEDFSAEEVSRLRDYLLAGGNLMLFTSYSTLELPNLRGLMKEFGMEAKENLIAESNSDRYYNYKFFLLPDTSGARTFYSMSSYTLLATNCHPISMVESEYPSTYTSLFSTSDQATLEPLGSSLEEPLTDEELPLTAEDDTDETEDTTGPYDIGALVTLSGENAGHICWLGSPEILDSDYNSAVRGGNYTYFLTILGQMCDKNYSLTIESKILDEDTLILSTFQIGFWGVVLIALIPLSVMTVGFVIHLKRKYR